MIIEDEAGEEEHGLLQKKVKNILLQTHFKGKKMLQGNTSEEIETYTGLEQEKNNLQEPIGLIVSLAPTSIL